MASLYSPARGVEGSSSIAASSSPKDEARRAAPRWHARLTTRYRAGRSKIRPLRRHGDELVESGWPEPKACPSALGTPWTTASITPSTSSSFTTPGRHRPRGLRYLLRQETDHGRGDGEYDHRRQPVPVDQRRRHYDRSTQGSRRSCGSSILRTGRCAHLLVRCQRSGRSLPRNCSDRTKRELRSLGEAPHCHCRSDRPIGLKAATAG